MSLYIDIRKTYPDFDLTVQLEGGGEVLALLGASGCGKSLTLKCIAGIEKPDKGRIVLNGKTVFDSAKRINISPQQRKVGFLFQNYALFPNMTVWNNIACVINKPKKEKHPIVEEIVQAFYLENIKDLYPQQISGGQQQRAALARILVANPEIMLLDEPFSALDSHLKWNMEQELMSVLSDFAGTTIFVSHDRDEAYRISDQIVVMNNGKIELIGNKEEIFESPKTLTAAKITGCKNFSQAEKLGDRLVKAIDWGIALHTAYPVSDTVRYVGVRAHHLERVSESAQSQKRAQEQELTQEQGQEPKQKQEQKKQEPAQGKEQTYYENRGNQFTCHIQQIIDEPFEKIVIFSFAGNDDRDNDIHNDDVHNKSTTKVRFEIPKKNWSGDIQKLIIRVPEDKIMCLE